MEKMLISCRCREVLATQKKLSTANAHPCHNARDQELIYRLERHKDAKV